MIGDQARLRQVLVNLVGNAIKFTPSGEVVVTVESLALDGDEIELRFVVSDTGIGIPAERLRHIFEAFEQVDNSMARKFGGTGLGLAICARLVELMQGRIGVESEVGGGSRFDFTARLSVVEESGIDADTDFCATIRDMRVLVVDDNAASRHALSEMLLRWEMQPTTVANTETALEALTATANNGHDYGLILIDAHMPGTDGFEMADRLRDRSPELMARCIMLLSSSGRAEDVARCDELGMSAYLLKPINPSELFDTLVAVSMGESLLEPPPDTTDSPDAKQVEPLTILLVEDSLYNQKLAVGVLQSRGHRVAVAENGWEAIAAMHRQTFDLVLMDVQMPVMDGLEATRIIRDKERTTERHIPIVAMTAQAMTGDRERCLEAGMDAYLAKPVRAAQLYDVIESVAITQLADTDSQPSVVGGGSEATTTPVLDWSVGLAATGGDRELLKEVVSEFLQEYPRLLDTTRTAILAGDAPTVQRAAHTIKGALKILGALSACECAEHVELLGKDNRLDGIDSSFSKLIDEVDALMPEILEFVKSGDADVAENA